MREAFTIRLIVRKISCLAGALTLAFAAHAQAPSNDECTGATNLIIGSTCVPVNGTTINATQSATLPDPDCGDGDSGWDDDVWYTFTPVAGQTVVNIDFASVAGEADLVAQIYTSSDNTCAGTFALFDCADDNATSLPSFFNLAVTPGTTYFMRVFSYSSDVGETGTSNFTVCVRTPALPPANDNCSGAIALTPAASALCTTPTSGSTESATASTETPPNTNPSGTNDDVWYSFVATTATHAIELTNLAGTTSDMAMAIYSGSCGSLTLIQDSDPETMVVGSLTPGQTYYVRVWTYSDVTDYSSFDICVTSFIAPANDNCNGAVSLTPAVGSACSVPVAGTTGGATASTETPPNTNPTGTDDDVWYSFVATSAIHGIELSNLTGTSTDMVMALYSGSCGALTLLQDSDPETMNVSGLTPGQTYYIRVWTYSDANDYANFDICVTTLTAPANDECATAIPISGTSGMVAGTNIGASQSQGPASCNSSSATASSDVWYMVTADFTGDIDIEIDQSELDAVTETFSGACGSLTLLDCTDGSNLTISATAGTTYYIRVDGWVNQQANFGIQVTGTALPVTMGPLRGDLLPEGRARLSWTTFKEQNNSGFEIQRSADGKSFSKIDFVATAAEGGNSSRELHYTYSDGSMIPGTVYYRLQQLDKDGKSTFSNIVKLVVPKDGATFTFTAAPNPVTHNLKVLTYGKPGANAVLYLTDLSGKIMMKRVVTGSEMQVDMNAYAPGLYLLKYTDADRTQTIKISKQ